MLPLHCSTRDDRRGWTGVGQDKLAVTLAAYHIGHVLASCPDVAGPASASTATTIRTVGGVVHVATAAPTATAKPTTTTTGASYSTTRSSSSAGSRRAIPASRPVGRSSGATRAGCRLAGPRATGAAVGTIAVCLPRLTRAGGIPSITAISSLAVRRHTVLHIETKRRAPAPTSSYQDSRIARG